MKAPTKTTTVLVCITIVLAGGGAWAQEAQQPAATPEEVLRQFSGLAGWLMGDMDSLRPLLTEESIEVLGEFEEDSPFWGLGMMLQPQLEPIETEIQGERCTVTAVSAPRAVQVKLVKENDQWKIDLLGTLGGFEDLLEQMGHPDTPEDVVKLYGVLAPVMMSMTTMFGEANGRQESTQRLQGVLKGLLSADSQQLLLEDEEDEWLGYMFAGGFGGFPQSELWPQEVRIEGETATISALSYQAVRRIKLVKEHGEWKIDLAATLAEIWMPWEDEIEWEPATIHIGEPIPAGPDAYTEQDFRQAKLEWNRKTLAEAYQEVGERDPAWDEPALELLEMFARYFSEVSEAPTSEELLAAAEPLMDTECNDPVVLYCVGAALHENEKLAEAEPYISRAVDDFEESRYSRWRAWAAAKRLYVVCQSLGGEKGEQAEQWAELAIKWAAEAAAEPFATPEQRILWEQFEMDDASPMELWERQFYEAITAQPTADPWIVNMASGYYHVAKAWEERGVRWASEVTEEGWEGFHKHLDLAREHLTAAWELHPEYPEAAAEMIVVVMAEGGEPGETERLWFDRAVAAQFDYLPAYAKLEWALSYRWGGSAQQLYEFGLECLNTKRFDTDVPWRLLEIVWQITGTDGEPQWWRKPGVYQNLKTMFEGILAAPRPDADRAHQKLMYAGSAWRAGAYDDARCLFDEMGDQISEAKFLELFKWSLARSRGEVYAATGPLGEQVRRAEALWLAGNVNQALPLFQEALVSATDEEVLAYLRDRAVTLRIEADLAGDDWVDIMPGEGMAGWQPVECRGVWSMEPDGSLAGTPTGSGALIACNARIEGNFEMRGEIELPPERGEGGVILRIKNPGWIGWTSLRIDAAGSRVIVGRSFYSPTQEKEVIPKQTNTFLVQVWNDRVTAYLNGELVFADYELEPDYRPQLKGQVGLGAWHGNQFEAPTLYRNVQIRRLTTRPTPQQTE